MTDKIPFADLSLQWKQIQDSVTPELQTLFDSSAFCLGPWVDRFEKAVAEYLGVKHAVAVNSGTSALHLAVICAGLHPGDKVLVPAQTFIGTVWGALYQGVTPVFCDVDTNSATLDPDQLERYMEPSVKAIIPVHLFGQPASMSAIMEFARLHNLTVIEDVAQALGGWYGNQRLGSIGHMGCTSFYPGKNLGAAGEGGLITTNNDAIATRLRALRSHGQHERYIHSEVGYNYRMEGIQGLVLGHKLKLLDAWTDQRRALAKRYLDELSGLPLTLPQTINGDHVWHLFVIRTQQRDLLREHLGMANIECGLHYPVPLHRQPCLSNMIIDSEAYPCADEWANHGLSLPLFVGMTEEQQSRVIQSVHSFFANPS